MKSKSCEYLEKGKYCNSEVLDSFANFSEKCSFCGKDYLSCEVYIEQKRFEEAMSALNKKGNSFNSSLGAGLEDFFDF
jgi:uncharacterized radical SAM superfamily protein